MTYTDVLIFAKTWGMAYLAIVFLVALAIVFRPGSREASARHGQIPLEED